MPQLYLRLMGRFEACLDGKPITNFETNKVRSLLAFLVAEASRAHPRETLAGMFWPDHSQASAMDSLRHALPALRKAIGDPQAQPAYLLITRETVQINRKSSLQVDLWEFERILARKPAGDQQADKINRLQSAVDLFNGPFLDGLYCKSDLFDKWAQNRREGLNRQVCEVLSDLARFSAGSASYDVSIRYARRLLELEPWDETAHRLVMEGLSRLGQRNAALAQYETCRETLRKDLSVEPEPETQRLYDTIRGGRGGPAEERPSKGHPAGKQNGKETRLQNLLAARPPIIGREREIAEIAGYMVDPDCRLLTLLGSGGMGKTHLALAAAARLADRLQDGACFVPLVSLDSPGKIKDAIAQELGFHFYPGEDPTQELLDFLERKELLLILDNFEHLLEGGRQEGRQEGGRQEGEGLVSAILQAAPRVKVVVTSRARLNLSEEILLPLKGLNTSEYPVWDLKHDPAANLFLSGARRVDPAYNLGEEDRETIQQICQRVQGIPLAILLAAGWMERLPPAEILEEIEKHSLDFLETTGPELPERQRSMRVIFDQSIRLLSPREQDIFAGLSVFRGGFTFATAQDVTGVTLRELRSLVDKSLVQHSGSGRYHFHELLRQYAGELLDQSPSLRETAHDRHAACFADAFAGWIKDLNGPRQFTALKEVGIDLDNGVAAWRWMVEHDQVDRMSRTLDGLAGCLADFYSDPADTEAVFRFFEQAGERLAEQVLPAPTAFPAGARLLARLGFYLANFVRGDLNLPDAYLRRSLDLILQLEAAGEDVRLEKARVFAIMGAFSFPSGRAEDFQKLFSDSLALFRDLGDDWYAARVLDQWGWAVAAVGDARRGRQMLLESLALHKKIGDRFGMDNIRSVICEISWHLLEFEEDECLLREILAWYLESGDPRLIASGKSDLARILIRQGKFAEGHALLVESLAILDQIGSFGLAHFNGLFLCEAEVHLGWYEPARARCQAIMEFMSKKNLPHWFGWNHMLFGFIELGTGRYAEASQHLEACLSSYPPNIQVARAVCYAVLSIAERAGGNTARAAACLIECLRTGVEKEAFCCLLVALPAAALLLMDWGEIERAVELYALAACYGYVANSSWFETIAGREIAARAAGLPVGVVEAAQARGKTHANASDLKAAGEEMLLYFEKISR